MFSYWYFGVSAVFCLLPCPYVTNCSAKQRKTQEKPCCKQRSKAHKSAYMEQRKSRKRLFTKCNDDRQTDNLSRNYWKLAQHSATLSLPTTLRRRYNTCCIRSSTIDSSRRTGAKSKIDVYHGYAATRPPFLPALSSAAATANIGLSHNFAAPLHLNIIKGPPDPSLLDLQSSPFFLILSINQHLYYYYFVYRPSSTVALYFTYSQCPSSSLTPPLLLPDATFQ